MAANLRGKKNLFLGYKRWFAGNQVTFVRQQGRFSSPQLKWIALKLCFVLCEQMMRRAEEHRKQNNSSDDYMCVLWQG